MDMVEKVADAMHDRVIGEISYATCEMLARVAIMAMRSPGDDFTSYLQLAHDLRPKDWEELIDAALSTPPETDNEQQ